MFQYPGPCQIIRKQWAAIFWRFEVNLPLFFMLFQSCPRRLSNLLFWGFKNGCQVHKSMKFIILSLILPMITMIQLRDEKRVAMKKFSTQTRLEMFEIKIYKTFLAVSRCLPLLKFMLKHKIEIEGQENVKQFHKLTGEN